MASINKHILHVYENLDLQFAELFDIFNKLINNQISYTEKIDGINVYLSYSKNLRSPVYARSQTDMKSGGLTGELLMQKFASTPIETQNTIKDIISVWRLLTKSINNILLLDDDKKQFYYNCEIVNPFAKNVISYDNKMLIYHMNKNIVYDKINGILTYTNKPVIQISNTSINGYKIIQNTSNYLSDSNTSVFLNDILRDIVSKIELEITNYGLQINNTIRDYVLRRLNKIKLRSKDENDIKNVLSTLDNILTPYITKILSTIKSKYILDTKKVINDIYSNITKSINNVRVTGNNLEKASLERNIKRLQASQNIILPIEGIVFEYNGQLYKLTGTYAAINQILGIQKFKKMSNSADSVKIAIFPGSFKPPHSGHYSVIEQLQNKKYDKIFIIISNSPRYSSDTEVAITAEMSMNIWKQYCAHMNNVVILNCTNTDYKLNNRDFSIASSPSPVTTSYKFLDALRDGDSITFVQSIKETDNRFKPCQFTKKAISCDSYESPITEFIDGTSLRNLIASNNIQELIKYIPSHVNVDDIIGLLNNDNRYR